MTARLQSNPAPDHRAAQQPRDSQSIGTLLRRLVGELATLLRQEFALASAELMQGLRGMLTGAAAAMAGGVVLFAGILVLLSSAVLGLSRVVAPWLAALIVGSAVSIAGVVALSVGVRRLRPQSLKPERAARSLSKDKAVLMRRAP
jgi:hypothetical protein